MSPQIVENYQGGEPGLFGLGAGTDWDSGTGTGAMLRRKTEKPARLILGGAFFLVGTVGPVDWDVSFENVSQSTTASELWTGPLTVSPEARDNTPAPEVAEASRSAVHELRRLSGLTWDELAKVFGVTRRSLHFWASGKPLSAQNEERLHRVLATVRQVDRGSAAENRAALRSAAGEAGLVLALLAASRFDEAVQLLGTMSPRKGPQLTPLSKEAWAARRPPSPADTVDALHDRVHRDLGRSRPTRSAKAK